MEKDNFDKDVVLIVDDHPNNVKVIASLLSDDYNLNIAESGHEALEMLENIIPDLILLDILMADMDGYEVCRRIKENPKTSHIPVIFLSAKTESKDIVKGLQSGAVDYIIKPFSAIELKSRVKNHLCLYHAIKERKRAEKELNENRRMLESVLQSQKEMICRFNTDGVITYVNKSFAFFYGKLESELEGTAWINLFPEHRHAEIKELISHMINNPGESVTYQQKVYSQTGLKKWHEWKGYPICDDKNKITEFQYIGYDITDLVLRQNLEKEVAITRNTLKFKQNFLASMSHEIRTPLTGIIGVSEVLEHTDLDNNQKDYLKTLQLSAENLRQIIDQVLDYSSIESGNMQLSMHPFKIETLAKDARRFFDSICHKPICFFSTLDKQIPDELIFDHKRITQVINNLIINAVKFTREGEVNLTIMIDHEATTADGEMTLKIMVSDTGIGIRPEKQKVLFSPFSQVHNIDTDKYTGMGLGLSVCKEIAELHGGEMGIVSSEGEGANIWFTIRAILPGERSLENKESSAKKEKKSLKILFAEDKVTTQKIVKVLLNSMGHQVTLVNNGKEAIETTHPESFDLILMDIQMPVMDGITATRIIKEKYPRPPFIIGVSANSFEGDRAKYITLGFDDYIRKPVTKVDFEKLIAKFFG
jgi:PAS domain S-box-containing protein